MARDGHTARQRRLRVVLERYELPLIRYATRLLGNADRARDVVQDVFIRLVERGDWLGDSREECPKADLGSDRQGTIGGRETQPCLSPFSAGGENAPDADNQLAAWLFAVCRNRSLDVRRKESRMRGLDDAVAESCGASDSRPTAAIEFHEATGSALKMLATLPNRQQEVIVLKFQAGLSYKEIAEITGASVSNVGFLMHTGLKSLRERLGEDPR